MTFKLKQLLTYHASGYASLTTNFKRQIIREQNTFIFQYLKCILEGKMQITNMKAISFV